MVVSDGRSLERLAYVLIAFMCALHEPRVELGIFRSSWPTGRAFEGISWPPTPLT